MDGLSISNSNGFDAISRNGKSQLTGPHFWHSLESKIISYALFASYEFFFFFLDYDILMLKMYHRFENSIYIVEDCFTTWMILDKGNIFLVSSRILFFLS